MLIDLSIKVTKSLRKTASGHKAMVSLGHMGTHFDVMNKEFPLSYTRREGIVFDVSKYSNSDIELDDDALGRINKDMFVAFYTGFIEKVEYGSKSYYKEHPQLSNELIDKLLFKEISIIGVDCAGIRRGKEHTPKDQYCADRGVLVVENLCNLNQLLNGKNHCRFVANKYPINFEGMTGLPCREWKHAYLW